MRPRFQARAGAALAAALCLSGCFASRAPLITSANADTPIADGSTLTEYFNCASEAGKLVGCSGYQFRSTAKVTLKDGVYTAHPDPTPALAAQFPGGVIKDVSFMLKKVGPEDYVLQLPLSDSAPTDPVGVQYLYELIRLQDGAAYIFELSCAENGDTAYVRSGALARISDALFVPTCEPASVDGLGKVFADRVANGVPPDEKYEIGPPK